MKEFTITAADGMKLSAALFDCKKPKAIIQVIHGAKEHKERYYDFIEHMNAAGYAVIVTDNRGHGASVNADYPLGHFDGIDQIVEDQYTVMKFFKGRYPGKELYVFGHSLGSCIARLLLQDHDDEISKLLLTGTVFPIPICGLGKVLCGASMKLHGRKTAGGIVPMIANADEDSWVCANPETMMVYRRDMLVKGCTYTNAAVASIVAADAGLTDYKKYKCKNPGLRILSVTGSGDVCAGGAAGLRSSCRALHKIGYSDVEVIVFPDMKHEVINEKDKLTVYETMLKFFNS